MNMSRKLLFCVLVLMTMPVYAESGDARVSVYVFSAGEALAAASIRFDQELSLQTDAEGVAHGQLNFGSYAVSLYESDTTDKELLNFNISIRPDSDVLILLWRSSTSETWQYELEGARAQQDSGQRNQQQVISSEGVASSVETELLEGQISSRQTGIPVAGARVFVSGLAKPLRSDDKGYFGVRLPVNKLYSFSIIHPDFSSQTFREIHIAPAHPVYKMIELTPAGVDLGEMVVAAPELEGGMFALMDEQRDSSAVADVISAEQISQSGDSDAAGALKRVTGLTLIDGKYIYVRGLGERYSTTVLNLSSLPSPDPTRRVVPLDLFPTGVLEGVVIQKTYSPDMPGEFGGGTVMLRTKGLPDEKLRNFTVSSGGNSYSTFSQGRTYNGGALDVLGVDDGGRAMPATLDRMTAGGSELLNQYSFAQREQAGESFANNYATQGKTLPPDAGFKLNMADRFEAYDANWGWGYNFSLNYKNQWRRSNQLRSSFGVGSAARLVEFDHVERENTENEIDLGGMLNLALELGNNHKLQSTSLLTRKTTNGVYLDNAYLSENDIYVRDTTLEWVERQLFSQQLEGEHTFVALHDLELNWRAAFSQAQRYEPDSRFYRYDLNTDGSYTFSRDGQSNERSFEDLGDIAFSSGADVKLPIYDLFGQRATIKSGINFARKQRDSQFVRFRFLTDWSTNTIDPADLAADSPEGVLSEDNIYQQGYILRNTTLPTDNYTAAQTLLGTYVMFDVDIFKRIKLMSGVRVENGFQEVVTYQLSSPTDKTIARLENSDVLPAFSATWQINKDAQWRIAASKTVNRPDFKELSEAPYIDPQSRDVVIGNPLLQAASITHLDSRWEWYVNRFEVMTLSAFYKQFDQPVERVVRPGAGGVQTFANAEHARNYGFEFSSRFWMKRFLGQYFSRFSLDTNLAWIDSEVDLGDRAAILTNQKRALQGQSPWIVNMNLSYENLIYETHASLLFNMTGPSIDSVGTDGLPDAYLQSVPRLDFVFSRRLKQWSESKLKMKLNIKNILDPEIKTSRGSETEKSSRKGVSISASLKYSWK